MKCVENLSYDDCKKVNESFWKLNNHDAQSSFLVTCIRQHPTKVHIQRNETVSTKSRPKQYSRHYSIPIGNEYLSVCKLAFCSILCVNSARVDV